MHVYIHVHMYVEKSKTKERYMSVYLIICFIYCANAFQLQRFCLNTMIKTSHQIYLYISFFDFTFFFIHSVRFNTLLLTCMYI